MRKFVTIRRVVVVGAALCYVLLAVHLVARGPHAQKPDLDQQHDEERDPARVRHQDMLIPRAHVRGEEAARVIPVLILACNRPEALRRVLAQVLTLIDQRQFSVTVSLDCAHGPTEAVVESFNIDYMKQPDQSQILSRAAREESPFNIEGYYRVCRHYRWALDQMVNVRHKDATTLIILEDDLDVSNDLFSYFSAFSELLEKDKTLLCVSGYNDNGKPGNIDISEPCRLWRSDFFPGLGWMTTSAIVKELLAKWPAVFWDDWLRSGAQTKGRSCIRPEVSKTTTFGRKGVSYGQFFDDHLAKVKLNSEWCRYNAADVGSMSARAFEYRTRKEVEAVPVVLPDSLETLEPGSKVKVICRSKAEWEYVSKLLSIMGDIRVGGVRNMYHLVVPTFHRLSRVYVDVSAIRELFVEHG